MSVMKKVCMSLEFEGAFWPFMHERVSGEEVNKSGSTATYKTLDLDDLFESVMCKLREQQSFDSVHIFSEPLPRLKAKREDIVNLLFTLISSLKYDVFFSEEFVLKILGEADEKQTTLTCVVWSANKTKKSLQKWMPPVNIHPNCTQILKTYRGTISLVREIDSVIRIDMTFPL